MWKLATCTITETTAALVIAKYGPFGLLARFNWFLEKASWLFNFSSFRDGCQTQSFSFSSSTMGPKFFLSSYRFIFHQTFQLMSAVVRLKDLVKVLLFCVKQRSSKHCFKNEWTLIRSLDISGTYILQRNEKKNIL